MEPSLNQSSLDFPHAAKWLTDVLKKHYIGIIAVQKRPENSIKADRFTRCKGVIMKELELVCAELNEGHAWMDPCQEMAYLELFWRKIDKKAVGNTYKRALPLNWMDVCACV